MSSGGNQLNKVRTFHSDMERVKPGSVKKSDITPRAKPKAVDLPPVLTPKKATPLTPPPVPPKKAVITPPVTAAKTDPVTKAPTTTNPPPPENNKPRPVIPTPPPSVPLPKNISADVANISSKRPTNDNDLSLMDTDSAIADGTIITDQKRERFKLFPAMWEATMGWISKGKENIEERAVERQKAIPKVSTIEGREEVIKKAAKQSALAPKDDYKKWAAKRPSNLKQQPEQKKASLTIKKKVPTKKPTWSHYDGEEETPAAETTSRETQGVEEEKVTPPAKPSVIPPLAGKAPSPEPVTNSTSKIEPVEIVIAPNESEQSKAKPTPPPEPARPTPPPQPKKARRGWHVPQYVWYGLVIMVSISAAGGGVAFTLWMFTGNTNEVQPPATQTPITIEEERPIDPTDSGLTMVTLPANRAAFYEAIRESAGGGGLSAVTITTGAGGGTRAASTESILEVLDWEASAPMLRAINKIEFGTYDSSPYVILRVTSFDTAFGGILAAEPNLSNDLAPLFGEAVTGTFDSEAGTEDNIREPYFVDELVNNIDVRVLRDATEAERIVYGFLNKNTIVIVPNAEVFADMAARMQ